MATGDCTLDVVDSLFGTRRKKASRCLCVSECANLTCRLHTWSGPSTLFMRQAASTVSRGQGQGTAVTLQISFFKVQFWLTHLNSCVLRQSTLRRGEWRSKQVQQKARLQQLKLFGSRVGQQRSRGRRHFPEGIRDALLQGLLVRRDLFTREVVQVFFVVVWRVAHPGVCCRSNSRRSQVDGSCGRAVAREVRIQLLARLLLQGTRPWWSQSGLSWTTLRR